MTNRRNGDTTGEYPESTVRSEVPFEDECPTVRVIEAVARADNVSPTRLTPLLYDVIDPDALDRLFGSSTTGSAPAGRIRFEMGDWNVVVDWGDKRVRVYDAIES